MNILRKISLFLLTFLIGTLFTSFISVPKASADPQCNAGGVYILWVRGSGQSFNDVEGVLFKQYVTQSLADLNIVDNSDEEFIEVTWAELGNLDGNYSIQNGEYWAASTPWSNFTPDFTAGSEYNHSVVTGTNELVTHLNNRVVTRASEGCDKEAIILGGFSQGANIIGDALARTGVDSLANSTKQHIAYVALYADPKANGIADGYGCPSPVWVRGDASCDHEGLLYPRFPYIPDSFLFKTGSWCDNNDGVCSKFASLSGGSHTTAYRDTQSGDSWIKVSADEISKAALYKVNELNDSLDANPALVVGDSGIVFSLHVTTGGCAKIFKRNANDNNETSFSLLTQISGCGWSTSGTSGMALVPGTNASAWMALVGEPVLGGCTELHAFKLSGSSIVVSEDLDNDSCGWSEKAPPAVTVDSSGNVYVAAVKGSDLWVFRRGVNDSSFTNLGSLGNRWSGLSGAAIATSPGGKLWVVATKMTGEVSTLVRQTDGSWDPKGTLGVGDWSRFSRPGLAVDNDGDVTVAIIKEGNGQQGAIHSYRRCSTCTEWHYVGQVGSFSDWSINGTLSMGVSMGSNSDDKVWLTGVKYSNTPSSGTTMWSLNFTPDQQENWLGSWSGGTEIGNNGWSQDSAPATIVAQGGTVFITAVKRNGDMWSFKRSTSGIWSNWTQIGGSGWAGKYL